MKSLIGRIRRYFLQVCFPASRQSETWLRGLAKAFAPSPFWRDPDLAEQTARHEPACCSLKGRVRGSIQVSGDGVPTVLLADHQTTGGYPKIATVISCDTDKLVQCRAGEKLRFLVISSEQATDHARGYFAQKAKYLDQISVARGSLTTRLMRENLNHGWMSD